MKKIKYVVLLIIYCFPILGMADNIVNGTKQVLTSPDGNYQFTFYQKQLSSTVRQMYYTLLYKGQTVVRESELGVAIDNKLQENALGVPNDNSKHWCDNIQLIDVYRSSVDSAWHPVYGEWSVIPEHYNSLILKFVKGNKETSEDPFAKQKCYYINVDVRAYNEGVAFRYSFPETSNGLFLHLVDEETSFAFDAGAKALHASWAQGPYSWKSLKDWTEEAERPLTMKLTNGLNVSLLEARMVDYVRTKFKLIEENKLQTSLFGAVNVMTPYSTSWRVIMVGEHAVDLINHDYLVLNLNAPCQLRDSSWIKPGKAFRTGLTNAEAMSNIDFCAAHGLQYIHFDARWYGPEMKMSSKATAVDSTKDFNIPDIVQYAKSKGIGVILYVNQRALYSQLDTILPLYEKWGVKGIKFGFVQVGSQMWSTWLHEAVRKCAEHHLMVDIHDEYRPTGYSRTYPNLMTQEGIRGNEEMPDATHNTILPFTRFLAGAADYTLCYYNPRVKNTHAHQLAMAAVYYSPLTWMFWYDSYKNYHGEKEIEFWEKIPTVFDETRALQGEPGEYIVTARRSATDWFLGAMTNTEGRTVRFKTDFLQKGKKYIAHLYEDDATIQSTTHVRCSTKKIDAGKEIILTLQPSGGAAIWFELVK